MYGRIICSLIACILVQYSACALLISLVSRGQERSNSLKMISFCFDCPEPDIEGSIAFGLTAKHSVQEYSITAEMAYCVPNFAELPRILNENQLNGRIAFVERGINGLLEKVTKIAKTGAAAIIIADDGRCNSAYSYCGPRAGSVAEGGFAVYDDEAPWRAIGIPVIMINFETAEMFRKLMIMKRISVPKTSGLQNMTILNSDDSNEEDL